MQPSEKTTPLSPQRVFLSYTHDSSEHQVRVLALADRLRRDGIEAILDQYQDPPSTGWLAWTLREVDDADVVLVICTETYNRRNRPAESQEQGKGASWEEALLLNSLSRPEWQQKLVPVIFEPPDAEHIPVLLRTKQWFDVWSEAGYAKLLQLLTQRSASGKPGDSASDYGEARRFARDLASAYQLRKQLEIDGSDTTEAQKLILDLKRRLRQGNQLQAGDILGDRFRLMERLGHGGFAVVWKAYDRDRKQLVAIKILHGQYAQDRSRRERFFRGARIMARLSHPAIVGVLLEAGEDHGFHFFVMTFAEGGDLRQAVLADRLVGRDALAVVQEVGEAVAFAHSRGVIHRDIKPSNVLLSGDGRPKLTDFDLVRDFGTTGGTRTGSVIGSVLYAAPELLVDAKGVNAQADIYSLAMTAVFVLHGNELPATVLRDPTRLLAGLNCSDKVRSALKKATAWEPEERYKSIQEFLRALDSSPPDTQLAPFVTSKYPSEVLSFRHVVSGAETLLENLHRDGVEISFCEESENNCWHFWLRLPESLRDLYGLAPQVLLLVTSGEVHGGDLLRARDKLYRSKLELDLDMLLVVDGEIELEQRLRRLSHGEEPWVPWERIGTNLLPLEEVLPTHLPACDIFQRKDPVTGLQFVGREALIAELSKALKARRAIGVFGLRKSGKTSVMRAVTDRLDPESSLGSRLSRDPDTPRLRVASLLVCWWDCQRAAARELEPIAENLIRVLADRLKLEDPALTARLEPVGTAMDRLDSLLLHALERARVPICLVLDEYDWLFAGGRDEPPIAGLERLFGLFRGHAQATGRFVLAVIGRDSQPLDFSRMGERSNPVLHWFERHWLGPMSKVDANQLLVGLGRRVLLDVQKGTQDLARFWTGGFPLLHREFGSALLRMSRTTRSGSEHVATDPYREQATEAFLDGDEPITSCREVFDLLTERHPDAAQLLRELASHSHGLDAASWQEEAARTLRRLGLLSGSPKTPFVPEVFRWYVRTFSPGAQNL